MVHGHTYFYIMVIEVYTYTPVMGNNVNATSDYAQRETARTPTKLMLDGRINMSTPCNSRGPNRLRRESSSLGG